MIALARFLVVFLLALTIVYVSLWFYFRAGARARLRGEWARDRPPLPEHTYVAIGLRDHDSDLRRKLVLGVYVVPLALAAALILILNYA